MFDGCVNGEYAELVKKSTWHLKNGEGGLLAKK